MTKTASMFVDYQQRAKEFHVGDAVSSPMASAYHLHGTVTAVWPAIGMVDVEWPNGSERLAVEDLQRYTDHREPAPPDVLHDNVPGGNTKDSVSKGDPNWVATRRVAESYVQKMIHRSKTALYWGAPDRHYRATGAEQESGKFTCPNCKTSVLRAASYKRADGVSERLFACPDCVFLVLREDVIGHPDYIDDAAMAKKADDEGFSRVRLTEGV